MNKVVKATSAAEALNHIQEAAATSCPEVRTMRTHDTTKFAHQGDVYLIPVADDYPKGELTGSRQVAVGDTQGSRHIATGDVEVYAGVQLPESFNTPSWVVVDPKDIFLGPVVVAKDRWVLTHPEHAHHSCPAGTYQVMYQGDPRMQARVAD